MIAIEVLARTDGAGVLWCDGRRTVDLPPGARIEVRRGARPVRLVRLHQAPFTDRLVAKFGLPGRGLARRRGERRRRAAEGRADDRGDPDRLARRHRLLDPRARPGPHRDHRRDRRRQDHGRDCARAAARRPRRQRRGPHRCPAARGSRAWSGADRLDGFAAAVEDAGGEVEDDRVVLARNVSRRGPVAGVRRRRRGAGGHAGRASPSRWSPCTASPTSTGCSSQRAQREALDRFGGARCWPRWRAYTDALRPAATRPSASSTRSWPPPASAPGRPTCSGSASARSRPSTPSRARTPQLAAEEARLGFADTLRTAAEQAREALSSEAGDPDALGAAVRGPRPLLDGVREHDAEAGELADRLAEITYLLSDLAADVASYAAGIDADPARLAARLRAAGGADRADPQVRRDRRRGARLGGAASATRLLDLDGTDERIERLRAEQRAAARRAGRGRRGAVGRPHRGRRPARPPRSPPSWRCSRCRTPGSRSRQPARRRAPPATRRQRRARVARAGSGHRDGVDEVEFLLAANTGSEPRPLHKGASGGELSRVMLALEVALAGTSPVPTFVFDEVDAGVGGAAAVEVGRRLAQLARTAQVLVVTHLPQVAAYADRHVLVEKASDGSVTSSGLTDARRRGAASRSCPGCWPASPDSDTALAHARELLEVARRRERCPDRPVRRIRIESRDRMAVHEVPTPTKHVFVTGGVASSLGKGLTASSLGRLLRSRGLRVTMQKLDPYLNVDPGTMNPFQHGEVFVTNDGAETDLDIGHYERFLDTDLGQIANVTTGQVYSR